MFSLVVQKQLILCMSYVEIFQTVYHSIIIPNTLQVEMLCLLVRFVAPAIIAFCRFRLKVSICKSCRPSRCIVHKSSLMVRISFSFSFSFFSSGTCQLLSMNTPNLKIEGAPLFPGVSQVPFSCEYPPSALSFVLKTSSHSHFRHECTTVLYTSCPSGAGGLPSSRSGRCARHANYGPGRHRTDSGRCSSAHPPS